jgi:arylsulfatase A-like enzyme
VLKETGLEENTVVVFSADNGATVAKAHQLSGSTPWQKQQK